jgi:sugar phosphate isomerase/epimerase
MNYRLFAMDTAFHHSLGTYPFEVRCEMLSALGYDATYLTLWNERAWEDLSLLSEVTATYGLEVAGIYFTLDIAEQVAEAAAARLQQLLTIVPEGASIELAVKASDNSLPLSDPQGDARVLRQLRPLLPLIEARQLSLRFYPHTNCWLERIGDAVRLCRALEHSSVGAVFCGFHWYAVDGRALPEKLAEAVPYLRSVNLCGSRRMKLGRFPATIEPLDSGELDNFAVLGLLRNLGYNGMIGIQGYSVGGDVYANLRRSLASFRDMEQRLAAHPHWAVLNTKDLIY